MNHRKVRRPDRTFATMDHNVPTKDIFNVKDLISKKQIETLRQNAKDFGIRLAGMGEADQGIIHVIGPQLGLTQPGQTIVCGDSHTSTHGAFGQLLLELGLQKSSTYLPPRPFGRLNPSRWASTFTASCPMAFMPRILLWRSSQNMASNLVSATRLNFTVIPSMP